MVTKKTYESPVWKVVRSANQDVVTASDNENDKLFITDDVEWWANN